MRNRKYSNGEIIIIWRAAECTHSTLCYRELRSVFDPSKRPWVDPKGASTAEILRIIEKCPSPALTFLWEDEQKNKVEESAKLYRGNMEKDFPNDSKSKSEEFEPAVINIRMNGPIIVTGDVEIIDENGAMLRPVKMSSLCRCGASSSMPGCDGSHFKIGFRD